MPVEAQIPQSLVLAQAAGPQNGLQAMLPLILILVVFYFLLVRPQQKRAREHRQLVENLKKNDRVVTSGGLHGRIVDLDDRTVVLEIAPGTQVRHERDQIAALAASKSPQRSER